MAREIKNKLITKANQLGFSGFGIAKAHLSKHHFYLKKWLHNNHHASMQWMENHIEKRCDPRELVPNAKTVFSFADPYRQKSDPLGKHIARYAQGLDYHKVLKSKIYLFFDYLKELYPEVEGRVFVDSAPVLEHYWAEQSGVGWIGKNTLTVTKNAGTFIFLGEIISTIDLPADEPAINHCGTCTACLDACPTDAFVAPYVLDANKCISYLTIEHRGDFTTEQSQMIDEHVYGCDICTEVCPWNNKIDVFRDDKYGKLPIDPRDLQQITPKDSKAFKQIYNKSPITRTKYEGLKRNIKAVKDNINKKQDALK